jgi:hypothetical protein
MASRVETYSSCQKLGAPPKQYDGNCDASGYGIYGREWRHANRGMTRPLGTGKRILRSARATLFGDLAFKRAWVCVRARLG